MISAYQNLVGVLVREAEDPAVCMRYHILWDSALQSNQNWRKLKEGSDNLMVTSPAHQAHRCGAVEDRLGLWAPPGGCKAA